MGKIKDIFTGKHRKFAWFVVIVTVLFLGSWLIGPGNTFIRWIRTAGEIRRQEAQMEYYRQEIDRMNSNIEELETDRDTLEKFARERFKFAAPGEDVYIVE